MHSLIFLLLFQREKEKKNIPTSARVCGHIDFYSSDNVICDAFEFNTDT